MTARISFTSLKTASKTTKMLGMGLVLATLGAFAACSAGSDEGTDTAPFQNKQVRYMTAPCPGYGCK